MVIMLPVFALFISVISLLFFFDILTYRDFLLNNNITESSMNESLKTDYNFALLPVFFGFISILFLPSLKQNKIIYTLFSTILIIFSIQIFFSGSRRGLFIFILIVLFLLVSQLFTLKKNNSFLKLLAHKSLLFLLFLISLAFLTFIFVTKTPYSSKNRLLELIGSKNILITKNKIAKQFLRYSSAIDQSINYQKIFNVLWTPVFNPYDPESSWGSRIHKSIYPLLGKNNDIVPSNAKGYMLDWSCNPSYYEKIDLCESYSLIASLAAGEGDSINSSVYCFVSNDFDGMSVALVVGSSIIAEDKVSGKPRAYYDLDKKGVWQKLNIRFSTKESLIQIYIIFSQNGVKNFSKLKGNVIYAYPQYQLIKLKNSANSFISKPTYKSLQLCNIFPQNSAIETFPENLSILHHQNRISISQKIPAKKESHNLLIDIGRERILYTLPKYYQAGILSFPLSTLAVNDSLIENEDPFRKWISKLISEDTAYLDIKSGIVLNNTQNNFASDRLERWRFALLIFSKEYNLKQKIFGGGFSFLNWYGYYMLNDKTKSDYPHNPLLYILLYSGIVGIVLYLFCLYYVFYYYLKYFKEYPLLFVFFTITFFFTFFSGGSSLDPPVMGFFIILPFFIHSVHRSDKIPKMKSE
jgi:hypothetical protein